MTDLLGYARLAVEALAEDAVPGQVRLHQLERDLLSVRANRQVNVAHPAHAQHGLDPVWTNRLTCLFGVRGFH